MVKQLYRIVIINNNNSNLKDPSLLATLSAKELEMLKSISSEELAPPPSDEDIFGQIETIKKQFEHENSQLNRQLEENKVRDIIIL